MDCTCGTYPGPDASLDEQAVYFRTQAACPMTDALDADIARRLAERLANELKGDGK